MTAGVAALGRQGASGLLYVTSGEGTPRVPGPGTLPQNLREPLTLREQ
jgi:hypothetical protein